MAWLASYEYNACNSSPCDWHCQLSANNNPMSDQTADLDSRLAYSRPRLRPRPRLRGSRPRLVKTGLDTS